MKTVWKYEFSIKDVFTLQIPKDAEILLIDSQNETGCLWILVDSDKPLENRVFCLYGTGHPITLDRQALSFIGSFQQRNGALVWHVFEQLTAFGE